MHPYHYPPWFIVPDGEVKHRTPLCPHVQGRVHYMLGDEEAIYARGENRCETCWWYRYPRREGTWTDPRFREEKTEVPTW